MAAACSSSAVQNVLDLLKQGGYRDPFKCSVVVKKASISELSLPTRAVSYTDSTGSTDGGTTPRSTIANNLIASSPPSILEYHSPSQRTNLSLHISSPASSDTTFTSPSSLLDFLSHDERPAREEPSSLSSAITKFLQEGEEEVYNVDHDTEEVLDNEITSMFEDEVAAEDIDDMYILDDDSEVDIMNSVSSSSQSTHRPNDEDLWAITSSSCTSSDDLVAPLRITLAKRRAQLPDRRPTKKRLKNHQLNRVSSIHSTAATTTTTNSDSEEDIVPCASRRRPTLINSHQNKEGGFKAVKQRVTFNLPDEPNLSDSSFPSNTFMKPSKSKGKGTASFSSSDDELTGSNSSLLHSTAQWGTDTFTGSGREISAILAHKSSMFLVVWADDPVHATYWIHQSQLHCPQLLREYFSSPSAIEATNEPLQCHSSLSQVNSVPEDTARINRTFVNGASINGGSKSRSSKTRRVQFSDEPSSSRQGLLTHAANSLLKNHSVLSSSSSKIFSSSAEYTELLRKWEKQLNQQIDGKEPRIHIENTVDQSPIPTNFTYVCKNNMHGCNVQIDIAATPGCNCGKSCFRSSECCPHRMNTEVAYNQRGNIKIQPGWPIYECNASCFCDSSCFNRVVQRGRQIPLCVFRTSNGRGWGVKTMQTLSKGQFVSEYIGEIISNEEAEKRGKEYDQTGSTYLFDLDFDKDDAAFTIDATNYGNISHFLNHSCDPNLQVYSVWIETLDARLPHLALFAKKKISAGEELTFDYQMGHNGENLKQKGRIQCLCGSQNCNRYLF